ncbi:MAG: MerC family mercury resistance protein [Polyangia bacterium]
MATVDFVYASDCPNVSLARANMLLAFARAGMKPQWREHRIGDPEAPAHTRGYGSPTILVDGHDVARQPPSSENCCRVYADATGWIHAPATDQIAAALTIAQQENTSSPPGTDWRSSVAALPGIVLALLPKIACPACWPAYAGALTSLGVGFLLDVRWLFPLTAVFMLIAVFMLGFRARRRRGFAPFFLGMNAATIVLAGKFGFESDAAMYAGLGLLVAASIWNTWPSRATVACPACIST